MSDRELLQSLGDYVPEFWRDLDCEMSVGVPEFWLRMDDALAKRGWDSTLNRSLNPEGHTVIDCDAETEECVEEKTFHYVAYDYSKDADCEYEAYGDTQNEAVRSVYESIIAKEGTNDERNT